MGLQPCPECDRHVRRAAGVCPFCAAKLPSSRSAKSFGVAVAGAAVLSTALTACPRVATKYGGPPPPERSQLEEQSVEEPPVEAQPVEAQPAQDEAAPDAEAGEQVAAEAE